MPVCAEWSLLLDVRHNLCLPQSCVDHSRKPKWHCRHSSVMGATGRGCARGDNSAIERRNCIAASNIGGWVLRIGCHRVCANMICQWECLNRGCKCLNGCGYALKRDYDTHPVRQCKAPPTVYLTDTILRDGVENEARMTSRPCVHLGEKRFNNDGTPDRTKAKCGANSAFLPVYQCETYRLCSPFGTCQDPQIIRPCYDCEQYTPAIIPESEDRP